MKDYRPTQTWIATTDGGGAASVTIPSELTSADLEDFGEWFQLILRTLHRQHAVRMFNAITADEARVLIQASQRSGSDDAPSNAAGLPEDGRGEQSGADRLVSAPESINGLE